MSVQDIWIPIVCVFGVGVVIAIKYGTSKKKTSSRNMNEFPVNPDLDPDHDIESEKYYRIRGGRKASKKKKR